MPYRHVGLRPGLIKQDLGRAIEQKGDDLLDLSPAFAQAYEEDFHVPAGIPHRPGTALTLELQQPPGVYTHLDWYSGDETLLPEQTHLRFASMEEVPEFVNWEIPADPYILDKYRLIPRPVAEGQQRGQGEEMWISTEDVRVADLAGRGGAERQPGPSRRRVPCPPGAGPCCS